MEKDNILSELIENIKDDKFIKIVFSDKSQTTTSSGGLLYA